MKEIVISFLGTEQDLHPHRTVLQKFEILHPGCQVKAEAMTWEEAWGKLFNITIQGEGPCISEIGSNWSNTLVGMQALRPFTPSEIKAIGGESAFFPASWKSAHLSDNLTIWSIPFRINTYVLTYQRDLLSKAGIDERSAFLTPQSFAETIQKLSDSGVQAPFLISMDYFPVSLLHTIASWVWAMGGDFISRDEHHVLFNQPEARAGIKAWFQLYGHIALNNRALTEDEVLQKFMAGNSAMWVGDFGNGSIILGNREQAGMAAMPGLPFVGGSNLVIWQHAKYSSAGELLPVALVNHLTSFNGQCMLGAEFISGSLPTRKDVLLNTDYPKDTIRTTLENTLQLGRSHNEIRLWPRIEAQLGKALADISKAVLAHPEKNLDAILDETLLPLEKRFNLFLNP